MAETALIGLDVDLSLINRRLAEAGNLTAKEARSMQTELVQAFKHSARASEAASKQISRATSKAARDAERDAKKAAREVERSIEGQASAVRGLFSAAIGGVGGDLLDLADATDGASGSMAGLGIALGALAIGPAILGGLAQGMIETANAGVEAKNALEEAGIAVDQLVTPAALAAIEQYEKQTKLAEQASQALSVQLGGAAARDAGIFNDALLGVKQTLASASESTGGFFATVGKWAEFSVEYSSVGGYLLINSLREQGVKAGEAKAKIAELAAEQAALALETDAAAQAMEDERAMLVALGMLSEEDTATTNRATDAIKRQRESYERRLAAMRAQLTALKASKAAADEDTQAAKDNAEATDEGTLAATRYASAVKDGTVAVTNAISAAAGNASAVGATAAAVDELAESTDDLKKQLEEVPGGDDDANPWPKLTADVEKAQKASEHFSAAFGPIISNLTELAAIEQRQAEQRVSQLRNLRAESRATYRDQVREFEASKNEMTAVEREAAEAELAALKLDEDRKRALLRQREKEAKKNARAGFKRMKGLQIAAAAIEGIRNAIALTAAYVPVAGPGAPAVATGIAAAQTATAIAIINKTPPPKFHFGTSAVGASLPAGIPGAEVPAVLERGEGVVSRRGMAAPGMAELVEAVNAGAQVGGRSAVNDIEADMLATRLNRPYAPHIRGRAMAGRNTFYRGR